jgi:(p)ppGpp synthase/HD superfamily hydrolase
MMKTKKPDRGAQRFGSALAFAAEKHARQRRKGARIPYISHPLAVASLVLENGGGEDEAVAALLHDVAEDQGGRAALAEIRERFGARVAAIVEGCSDTLEDPKPAWRPRKEAYVAHLRRAARSVWLVAAADKLLNARAILKDYRSLGDRVWARFSAPKEEVLWYYRAVTRALEARGSSPLVEELDRTVKEIVRHSGRAGR